MFAIDEAKFPPPTPAIAARTINVVYDTPGRSNRVTPRHGTNSRAALTTVQLRPPKRATANVYGRRITDPTSAGTAVRRNFPAGSTWYAGPRKSTSTDHSVQTENPMCSHRIDTTRLRRAIRAPVRSQKSRSSGRQSVIQRRPRGGAGVTVSTTIVIDASLGWRMRLPYERRVS